jgi:hypothetical protein
MRAKSSLYLGIHFEVEYRGQKIMSVSHAASGGLSLDVGSGPDPVLQDHSIFPAKWHGGYGAGGIPGAILKEFQCTSHPMGLCCWNRGLKQSSVGQLGANIRLR